MSIRSLSLTLLVVGALVLTGCSPDQYAQQGGGVTPASPAADGGAGADPSDGDEGAGEAGSDVAGSDSTDGESGTSNACGDSGTFAETALARAARAFARSQTPQPEFVVTSETSVVFCIENGQSASSNDPRSKCQIAVLSMGAEHEIRMRYPDGEVLCSDLIN